MARLFSMRRFRLVLVLFFAALLALAGESRAVTPNDLAGTKSKKERVKKVNQRDRSRNEARWGKKKPGKKSSAKSNKKKSGKKSSAKSNKKKPGKKSSAKSAKKPRKK